MRLTFCDGCHKKMEASDFRNLQFRGNNIVFEVKVRGLGNDYCWKCVTEAMKEAVELKEFT